MRIAVLGAGVIGVTAAWELLRDGHEVVLIDREEEAASFTSAGNAGLISPGHAYAWASPAAPGMLVRSLWRNDQALRFKPSLDARLWSWTLKFLGQCTEAAAARNTAAKVGLCTYSRDRLNLIAEETGIAFSHVTDGCLFLHRSQAALVAASKKADVLRRQGVEVRTVTMAEAVAIDPALAPLTNQFAGALYAPGDQSGDCRTFVRALAAKVAEAGGDVRFGTTVQALDISGDRVTRAVTDKGDVVADAYMVSLGVMSPFLVKTAGLDLPIYPIKGYSLTAPVAGRNNAPRVGGIDEANLIAYARYDDRIRVTATAEFAGYDTSYTEKDFRHMYATIRSMFPDAADWQRTEFWAGLRPMTPTGLPIFGRGRVQNLWINTGQGHMGWTMGAGSARIAADLIAGRAPEVDTAGMMLPN